MRTDARGNIVIRDAEDGTPSRIEGLAIPYGTTISIAGGKERFKYGAFRDAVAAVKSGERYAYLTAHDGSIAAVIDSLTEKRDGLYFGAELLSVPAADEVRAIVAKGINGVSAEIIPGVVARHGDVQEHISGVRLAAVAGSYAPAYLGARAMLRDAARQEVRTVPNLSVAALTERRSAIASEATTIRTIAETEGRDLEPQERDALAAIEARTANIDTLLTDARAETERRDAERSALPQRSAGSPAFVTRAETVYGPGTERSYFSDLMAMTLKRDSDAIQRMTRHRMLVTDLAEQIEKRAVESTELAGAYPTNYYPDLYVPDIAYTGPLSAFFAVTPISAPNPIIVPSFASVTGDTAPQATENTALSNVDVATAPKTLTPKTIGGETIVSRQSVDGASPGTDVIIGGQLRELLMRDTEREIALVLEALTASGTIADTAGTGGAQSGRDLYKGIAALLGTFYAGAAAGGAGARMLPAEGVFVNSTDWGNLVAGEDTTGRPLLAYINPTNALGQLVGAGFQKGQIGGVPVEPAWAILSALNEIIARRNDARQWKSAVLDVRLMEREGPQSVVFAIMQYFGFAVLEPKGVRRYTYTNV
jgi:hypothetical protein